MDLANALQVAGTVVAILGVATPVILWSVGRGKKGIGWEVVAITPLIVRLGKMDYLEISFQGKVVEEPYYVRVRICNAERGTISATDFRKPITLSFGTAEVFPFSAPKCSPPGLSPNLTWSKHEVSIDGLDLNYGSEMEITGLVAKRIEAKDIECHTLVHDAVNKGDARRLNSGAPTVIHWMGTGLMWALAAAGVGAVLLCFLIVWEIWEQTAQHLGVLRGSLVFLGMLAAIVAFVFVVRLCIRLFNRSKWPDYWR